MMRRTAFVRLFGISLSILPAAAFALATSPARAETAAAAGVDAEAYAALESSLGERTAALDRDQKALAELTSKRLLTANAKKDAVRVGASLEAARSKITAMLEQVKSLQAAGKPASVASQAVTLVRDETGRVISEAETFVTDFNIVDRAAEARRQAAIDADAAKAAKAEEAARKKAEAEAARAAAGEEAARKKAEAEAARAAAGEEAARKRAEAEAARTAAASARAEEASRKKAEADAAKAAAALVVRERADAEARARADAEARKAEASRAAQSEVAARLDSEASELTRLLGEHEKLAADSVATLAPVIGHPDMPPKTRSEAQALTSRLQSLKARAASSAKQANAAKSAASPQEGLGRAAQVRREMMALDREVREASAAAKKLLSAPAATPPASAASKVEVAQAPGGSTGHQDPTCEISFEPDGGAKGISLSLNGSRSVSLPAKLKVTSGRHSISVRQGSHSEDRSMLLLCGHISNVPVEAPK